MNRSRSCAARRARTIPWSRRIYVSTRRQWPRARARVWLYCVAIRQCSAESLSWLWVSSGFFLSLHDIVHILWQLLKNCQPFSHCLYLHTFVSLLSGVDDSETTIAREIRAFVQLVSIFACLTGIVCFAVPLALGFHVIETAILAIGLM